MKLILGILFLYSFNLFAANSKSQSELANPSSSKQEWNITLGAAGISSSTPYRGREGQNNIFPLLTAIKGKFSFEADRFKYKNLKHKNVSGFTYLKYDSAPFNENDSKILRAMDSKSAGAGLGQVLSIRYGPVSYGVDSTTVIGLPAHGVAANLYSKYSQRPFNAFGNLLILKYSISLNYMDAQRSNYRYGVKESEADLSIGRNQYKLNDTFGSSVGLESIYLMGPKKKWVLVNNITASLLDSKISDSPIVNEDGNFLYVFGLGYKL